MKPGLTVLAALLAGSCAVPPPDTTPRRGAVELAGRRAGPAQRCVLSEPSQGLRISDTDRHMLIYGSGRTIWANDLGRCGFGSNDVIVTEVFGSYYCRGDITRSFDRFSRIPGPACVLGNFIPYTRG